MIGGGERRVMSIYHFVFYGGRGAAKIRLCTPIAKYHRICVVDRIGANNKTLNIKFGNLKSN